MTDSGKYVEYIMEQAQKLLAIDSPSGYGREVREYLLKECMAYGKGRRPCGPGRKGSGECGPVRGPL